jgi:ribosomal protein L35AE/L33A
MTNLAALYGIDTQTHDIEIIIGCDRAMVVHVTDSTEEMDFTAFTGYCHWLNVSWDRAVITNDNKIPALAINNIVPTERAGNYDVSYLIEITAAQTANLTIGKTIYGDLLITDGTSEKVVARFRANIRGRSTLRP